MGLPVLVLDGVTIQMPTTHGWLSPESLGTGGLGDEVLPGIWKYGLAWNFLDPEHFKEVWDIHSNNRGSTFTAQLPEIGADPYALKNYVCSMSPVVPTAFMEGHYVNVRSELVGIDITV